MNGTTHRTFRHLSVCHVLRESQSPRRRAQCHSPNTSRRLHLLTHFATLLMRLQTAISFRLGDLTDLSPLNGEPIDRLFLICPPDRTPPFNSKSFFLSNCVLIISCKFKIDVKWGNRRGLYLHRPWRDALKRLSAVRNSEPYDPFPG
jgi:hypothetical protein